jgi:hypothetical protein
MNTLTDSNSNEFDVNNVTGDWDGLIYTFCWKAHDNIVNGFIPEYCIESWGKKNTVMLMEMFEDYNYNITCRVHNLPDCDSVREHKLEPTN